MTADGLSRTAMAVSRIRPVFFILLFIFSLSSFSQNKAGKPAELFCHGQIAKRVPMAEQKERFPMAEQTERVPFEAARIL